MWLYLLNGLYRINLYLLNFDFIGIIPIFIMVSIIYSISDITIIWVFFEFVRLIDDNCMGTLTSDGCQSTETITPNYYIHTFVCQIFNHFLCLSMEQFNHLFNYIDSALFFIELWGTPNLKRCKWVIGGNVV